MFLNFLGVNLYVYSASFFKLSPTRVYQNNFLQIHPEPVTHQFFEGFQPSEPPSPIVCALGIRAQITLTHLSTTNILQYLKRVLALIFYARLHIFGLESKIGVI